MIDGSESGRNGDRSGTTRRTVLKTAGVVGVGLSINSGTITGREVNVPGSDPGNVAPVGDVERGSVSGTNDTTDPASHEINSCTTITSPGTYDVVADITTTGPGPCIDIQAHDVTLRGNGHELRGDGNGIGVAANLDPITDEGNFTDLENISVENIQVSNFRTGIRYESVFFGKIANVTARTNGGCVFLGYQGGTTLRNCTLADSRVGFGTGRGDPDFQGGPGSTLKHNRIVSNEVGIGLGFGTHGQFVRNRIVGNRGGALHSFWDTSGSYSGNVICNNQEYGIFNEDRPAHDDFPAFEDIVGATDNYWGAANGPSSFGTPESPYTDPITGEPADGDGDAITESLERGVANVHFDPFLTAAPADAGLEP